MNLLIFSLCILPFLISVSIMFGIFKSKKLGKLAILPKCTGSAFFVLSAVVALLSKGENPFQSLMFWALITFAISDGLLDVHFLSGMAFFGAGHVLVIIWALQQGPFSWVSIVLWLFAMLIVTVLFRKIIKKMKAKIIPFIIYAGVLIADSAIAFMLAFTVGPQYTLLSIGAAMFFVSDILVGKQELHENKPWENVILMILYWGALYMFSGVLWMI